MTRQDAPLFRPDFTPNSNSVVGSVSDPSETAFRLSPLTAGQTYYLKLVVVDTAGHSTASSEVSCTLPTKSGAYEWEPGDFTILTDVSTTHFDQRGLSPKKTYYYKLTVKDTAGLSTDSNEVSFTTAGPTSDPPTVSLTSPAAEPTVSGTVMVQVNAQDEAGIKAVKVFLEGPDSASPKLIGTTSAPPFQLAWNTLQTKNGLHTLRAWAYDGNNGFAESEPITVTVSNTQDPIPPTVLLDSPLEGQRLKGTVVVAASAKDNVGVARVEFTVDGVLKATDETGPFGFEWDTAAEADGSHLVQAKAFDGAGNCGQSARVPVVTCNGPDNTPPTAAIVSPANNAQVHGFLTVLATVGDNVAVETVRLLVDGVVESQRDQEPWTLPWDTTGFSNGTHTLQAEVRDRAGNAGWSETIAVTVNNPATDTTPPTVHFTAPANGSTLSGEATVTVEATDEVAVAKVIVTVRPEDRIWYDGPFDASRSTRMFVLATPPYTVALNTAELASGKYQLCAEAVDTSGNRTASEELVVEVSNSDTVPPTVTFEAPTANETIGGRYKVLGAANDNAGIRRVDFYLDYGMSDQKLLASRAKGDYSFYWDTTEVSEGVHTLSAIATDLKGNKSEELNGVPASTITVRISNPAPTATIEAPGDGATVGGSQVSVRVAYAVTPPADKPINKLELLVDGVVRLTKNLTNTHRSGIETLVWNSTTVADGTHSLSVKAYDTRGLASPASSVSVVVDNTNDVAPQSVHLEDPYNVTYNGVSLRWTASSDTDFLKYEVHKSLSASFTPDASTLVGYSSSLAQTTFRLSPLTAGQTYYLKVRVVDAANKASDSNEVSCTLPTDDSTTPTHGATIETEYNLADKITTVRDWLGTVTASYDALNRDVAITDVYGRTTQYEYDANGNRSALVYHDGHRVEYQYDNANRLLNVKRGTETLASYQYDSAGVITRQDNSNGTYSVYSVDTRNRITNISHKKSDGSMFLGLSYLYDSGGNRTREKQSDGAYRDFFYDDKGQLTRETKRTIVGDEDPYGQTSDDTAVYDYSYTFDAVGNRLTYKDEVTNSTTVYSYNNMNQMLTAGNVEFGYDDNGNMVSKTVNGQVTFQHWDPFGKLVKLENADGSVVKFVYDGVGHRVKRWRSNGNETVYFVNDKSGDLVQLLSELDASGNLVARYTLGNTLLTMDTGTQTYSYHFDALGSTRLVTDPSAGIVDGYEYDAYGNVLLRNPQSEIRNPYGFVAAYGYYTDPDTGLLYLRARYYSPSIGRFVSMDSYLGQDSDPGSLHRYLYCVNSPIVSADPSGQFRIPTWAWNIMGAGGLVWGMIQAIESLAPGTLPPWVVHLANFVGGLDMAAAGFAAIIVFANPALGALACTLGGVLASAAFAMGLALATYEVFLLLDGEWGHVD